jgi:hypothetical protein
VKKAAKVVQGWRSPPAALRVNHFSIIAFQANSRTLQIGKLH